MTQANQVDFDYDSIPVGYYDTIFQRRKGAQSKWHHLKFQRVARELPAEGQYLDVACGPGTFIGTVSSQLFCTGVDIAAAQIDYASKHYGNPTKKFQMMEPGRLPFPDATFDVVTSVELIEHISPAEAAQLFLECKRVLKPGGKLIVTTPNYACLWPMIEWFLNKLSKVSYESQHITKYKPASLAAKLNEAGLGNVKVETCLFSAPFMAAISWGFSDFVARIEPGFLVRKRGHLLIGTATKS
jgi:2-polyprenyl-3-methyl-5-hydroxy-6-metoxy-1,4-benzoquinol methylase